MASPTAQCLKRLQIELRKLATEPGLAFEVGADPQNMLRCYFVLDGPAGTPYAGGRYVGLLEIPPDYPFKPPSVQMCTPSGRFRTGMQICLSNSSYHPEQWSPMWGLRTILIALISFFASNETTTGSMESSEAERRKYAQSSRQYNVERIRTVYKRALPDAFAQDTAHIENQQKEGSAAAQQLSSRSISSEDSDVERDDEERDQSPAKKTERKDASENGGASGERAASTEAAKPPNGAAPPQTKKQQSLNGDSGSAAAKQDDASATAAAASTDAKGPKPHRHYKNRPPLKDRHSAGEAMRLGGFSVRRLASLVVLLAVGIVLFGQLH